MPDTIQDNIPDAKPIIIGATSVKLPALWTVNTLAWFTRAEAEFLACGIKSETTKHCHVLRAMTEEQIMSVFTAATSPTNGSEYTCLKAAILKITARSDQERVNTLLFEEQLGDNLPSKLLIKMKILVPESETKGIIFREIFLLKLPSNVTAQLAAERESSDVDTLAKKADSIIINLRSTASSSGMQRSNTVASIQGTEDFGLFRQTNALSQMENNIEKLTLEIASIRGQTKNECFFHARWGKKAWSCKMPCRWNGRVAPKTQSSGN